MSKPKGPVASTAMLIRRPVAEVFHAFVDPAVTSRFWFTHGSGPLEAGRRVRWRWAMYDVAAEVDVQVVETNRRVVFTWPSRVEWRFSERADGTLVEITDSGFDGSPEEQARKAIDSAGGFSFVLAGAKALLEHDLELNLVADRHPDGFDPG